MRISFIGNFGVDYSSESHYLKTFHKLGHEVVTHQENTPIPDIQKLANCDMLFWVHTHGWHTEGLEVLISTVKAKGVRVVGYHLDLWLGIERQKDLENDSYWKLLDMFFCTDKLMVDYLNERSGMPKAFFLPAGVFEDEAYMAEPDTNRFPHEVIFTGSKGYHHEWAYRPQLVDWLQETYGEKFGHYGGDGIGRTRIVGHDLNTLYASAKVVVGDTLCKDFKYPYYLSDRIFETTGRGGFLIFPYIQGIEDLFEIGKEILVYDFGDFEQLKYLIDKALNDDKGRARIRLEGHLRSRNNHTYTHRLKELIEIVTK